MSVLKPQGTFFIRTPGNDWEAFSNLVTDEGFTHLLGVAMGTLPKPTGLYLALFSGDTSPAANWTGANFATVANEIVSLSEGYTSATRPQWTPPHNPANPAAIDNLGTPAPVTIAATGELIVTGCALLTSNVRGGTSGSLIAAVKYPIARKFQNNDTFDIAYRLTLTR